MFTNDNNIVISSTLSSSDLEVPALVIEVACGLLGRVEAVNVAGAIEVNVDGRRDAGQEVKIAGVVFGQMGADHLNRHQHRVYDMLNIVFCYLIASYPSRHSRLYWPNISGVSGSCAENHCVVLYVRGRGASVAQHHEFLES